MQQLRGGVSVRLQPPLSFSRDCICECWTYSLGRTLSGLWRAHSNLSIEVVSLDLADASICCDVHYSTRRLLVIVIITRVTTSALGVYYDSH